MHLAQVLIHVVQFMLQLVVLCHDQADLVVVVFVFSIPVKLCHNCLVEVGYKLPMLDVALV